MAFRCTSDQRRAQYGRLVEVLIDASEAGVNWRFSVHEVCPIVGPHSILM
jgi:hypothetical protein